MGLATIDSHSQKELTEIHKIQIQPFENVKIYKEMYGNPDAVRHSIRMPEDLFMSFRFVSFQSKGKPPMLWGCLL